MKNYLRYFMAITLAFLLIGCSAPQTGSNTEERTPQAGSNVEESALQAGSNVEESAPQAGNNVEESVSQAVNNAKESAAQAADDKEETESPDEEGIYSSRDEVALYIHTYGHLPSNYITKKEAEKLGWQGGSLEPYAPGKCIGGSRFGNYEGLLPEKEGRIYTECDIDTLGKDRRGAKRLVFSNDGLIYYTEDHYESFELLYGEE